MKTRFLGILVVLGLLGLSVGCAEPAVRAYTTDRTRSRVDSLGNVHIYISVQRVLRENPPFSSAHFQKLEKEVKLVAIYRTPTAEEADNEMHLVVIAEESDIQDDGSDWTEELTTSPLGDKSVIERAAQAYGLEPSIVIGAQMEDDGYVVLSGGEAGRNSVIYMPHSEPIKLPYNLNTSSVWLPSQHKVYIFEYGEFHGIRGFSKTFVIYDYISGSKQVMNFSDSSNFEEWKKLTKARSEVRK